MNIGDLVEWESQAAIIKVRVIGEVQYQRRIKDMLPNEVGYCVPWAFNPLNGDLNIRYPVAIKKCGTMDLKVRCVNKYNNEYEVDVTNIRHLY